MSGQRTLAAIVFTDAVEFSARVGRDEEGTIELIRQDLDLMAKMCEQHEGRVLKSTGDGLMMLFTSAVQAVTCSLEIQKALGERVKTAPDKLLLHRIGVHLGDVILADGDALGEGVNVASRLQEEAEPGGICLSQVVYDVVKNRLFLQAVKVADLRLKNIPDPVSAYKVAGLAPVRKINYQKKTSAWASMVGAGGLLLVAGVALGLTVFNKKEEPNLPRFVGTLPSELDLANVVRNDKAEADAAKREVAAQAAEIEKLRQRMEAQEKKELEAAKKTTEPNVVYKYVPVPGKPQQKAPVAPKAQAPESAAKTAVKTESKTTVRDGHLLAEAAPITPTIPSTQLLSEAQVRSKVPPIIVRRFENAKREFAKDYDFEGMQTWVEQHDDKLPQEVKEQLKLKYVHLDNLMDWFKLESKDWKPGTPLEIASDGSTAWIDEKGMFHIKQGDKEIVKKMDDLDPKEMNLMIQAAVRAGMKHFKPAERAQVIKGLNQFQREFNVKVRPGPTGPKGSRPQGFNLTNGGHTVKLEPYLQVVTGIC